MLSRAGQLIVRKWMADDDTKRKTEADGFGIFVLVRATHIER